MHINEFLSKFNGFLCFLEGSTAMFFWVLIIYGFGSPFVAGLTLISVLIHECGHECCLLLINGRGGRILGRANGFRIKNEDTLSYSKEIWLYASGAVANFATALLALLIGITFEIHVNTFIIVNMITAISNLLPVRSYDGYGILRSLIDRCCAPLWAYRALDTISLAVSSFAVTLSLYLMWSFGEGYWIYGVFLISVISELDNLFGKQKTGF